MQFKYKISYSKLLRSNRKQIVATRRRQVVSNLADKREVTRWMSETVNIEGDADRIA